MRTDANNLVTTAATTHHPEQKETIHMVQMLRKESCSGAIDDLGHIPTQYCLADCLTKNTISPDVLVKTVETGKIPLADARPMFRDMLAHKAFESQQNLCYAVSMLDSRPDRDYWEHTGSYLIRHHVRPRSCLFDPSKSNDIPVNPERLFPIRQTCATTLFCNKYQHSDSWPNIRDAPLNQHSTSHWIGTTVFVVRAD